MPAESILRLNPSDVVPSPYNRPTPLGKLQPLIESIRAQTQLQAGRVRRHPTLSGRFECIYGHRRLAVQLFLGGEFIAILHEEPLTEADIIRMQLTENLEREDMSFWEIADAVTLFVAKQKCTQGKAAELLGIDEAVVSKAMTVSANLIEEYRPRVESGEICKSNAHLCAMLSQDLQRQVDPTMKREAFVKLAKKLKGGKERKAKALKHTDGPASVVVPTNWPAEKIVEWLSARLGAARDWLKKGVPPEKWGAL